MSTNSQNGSNVPSVVNQNDIKRPVLPPPKNNAGTTGGVYGMVTKVDAKNAVSNSPVVRQQKQKEEQAAKEAAEKLAKEQKREERKAKTQAITKGIGQTLNAIGSAIPDKNPALNAADAAKSAANQSISGQMMSSGNPYLTALGAAMQVSQKAGWSSNASTNGSALENIGNFVGGLIPGSKFLAQDVAGLDVNQRVASSKGYAGVAEAVSKAKQDAGGSFLFGADKINDVITKAALMQDRAAANLEKADMAQQASNNPLLGMRTQMQMSGGYNPLVAKQGRKLYNLSDVRSIISNKTKKLQYGGNLDYTMSLDKIEEKLEREMPNFWYRTKLFPTWLTWEDSKGNTLAGGHELQWDTTENGRAVVFPMIQEIDGKLTKFDDWQKAKQSALDRGDFIELSEEEASMLVDRYESLVPEYFYEPFDEDFNNFMHTLPLNQRNTHRDNYDTKHAWELNGKPATFEDAINVGMYIPHEDGTYHGLSMYPNEETGNQEDIESFKQGGAFNVIPSGALHKNKHHLSDIDEKFKEVTHKGIPVISEEEGGIVQHAEVEKEEIIFRYDVTKKLEELMKEDTDEAAIEAGKLLVDEILNNTIDNTKNLL